MWHVTCDMWHVTRDKWHKTCDMWHMTCDMWPATRDMWHMTHRVWWTLCQIFSSLALTVWKLWWFEDISTKERWLNQSINYGGVYRTAPATPGLLIRRRKISKALWFCHLTIYIVHHHNALHVNCIYKSQWATNSFASFRGEGKLPKSIFIHKPLLFSLRI